MSWGTDLVLMSNEHHQSEIVLLIDSTEDLNQLLAPKESEVKRLFSGCEKCEYCISLRLVSIRDSSDEYDYYLQMKPKFKKVENIEDHLSKEHDVCTCSHLGYMTDGSGWSGRLYERSQVGIQDYYQMLTVSELEKLCPDTFDKGLKFISKIDYEIPVMRPCPEYVAPLADGSPAIKMRRLLESGYLSDLDIITRDGTIKGHKAVLAMASPVLKAMFESDREQKRESLLKLDSVNTQVAKNFLHYMYTNELNLKVEDEHEMAMELLILADYYQIDSLKLYCEGHLTDMLSTENAVDTLMLSVTYKTQNLRKNSLRFIGVNKTIFAARDDLNELMGADNMELRKDIMKAFAKSYALANN